MAAITNLLYAVSPASAIYSEYQINQALNYQVKLQDGSYVTGRDILNSYLSNSTGKNAYTVDPSWYMQEGAGRYFDPMQVPHIKELIFQNRYNTNEIDLSSIDKELRTGSVSQYTTSGSDDYAGRAFVFGGTSFRIVSGTLVTDGEGGFALRDVRIAPMQDDFDFKLSGKGVFEVLNLYLKMKFDPYGEGKSVRLFFGEDDKFNIPDAARKTFNVEGEVIGEEAGYGSASIGNAFLKIKSVTTTGSQNCQLSPAQQTMINMALALGSSQKIASDPAWQNQGSGTDESGNPFSYYRNEDGREIFVSTIYEINASNKSDQKVTVSIEQFGPDGRIVSTVETQTSADSGKVLGREYYDSNDRLIATSQGANGPIVASQCFPAGTAILLAGGDEKPIEDIRPGDRVLAFESAADAGRGALQEREVVRLFGGVTREWIRIEFPQTLGVSPLTLTPRLRTH